MTRLKTICIVTTCLGIVMTCLVVGVATGASAADPIAVVDGATTFESVPVRIDVLGNDSDPDADTLSVASATSGTGARQDCEMRIYHHATRR